MSLPIPLFRPPPLPEPVPVVRVETRDDVPWTRALFRAPSLAVYPRPIDAGFLADELRRVALGER